MEKGLQSFSFGNIPMEGKVNFFAPVTGHSHGHFNGYFSAVLPHPFILIAGRDLQAFLSLLTDTEDAGLILRMDDHGNSAAHKIFGLIIAENEAKPFIDKEKCTLFNDGDPIIRVFKGYLKVVLDPAKILSGLKGDAILIS
jgi:hypothetical protein